MKKAIAIIPMVIALAAASPALAKPAYYHSDSTSYGGGSVDSGWGPPSNWGEIEISHPEGGG